MKKALLIVFLIASSISVEAQYDKAKLVDVDKGLKESKIKLGMELKNFPYLVPTYKDNRKGYSSIYLNPNENLILGAVKLIEIKYFFTNDTLNTILLFFDKQDYEKVAIEFSKIYGVPSIIPIHPNISTSSAFGWRGEEIILTMHDGEPTNASFYIEKKIIYDFEDSKKKMFEETLNELKTYWSNCKECSLKNEKKQRKTIEKNIRKLKQFNKLEIKLFRQKLKNYKDSKYIQEN